MAEFSCLVHEFLGIFNMIKKKQLTFYAKSSNLHCPYCHGHINEVGLKCLSCGARHHHTCWFLYNKCSTCKNLNYKEEAPKPQFSEYYECKRCDKQHGIPVYTELAKEAENSIQQRGIDEATHMFIGFLIGFPLLLIMFFSLYLLIEIS